MNVSLKFGSIRAKKPEAAAAGTRTIVICDANPILAEGIQKLLQSSAALSDYSITVLETHDYSALMAIAPDVLIIDPWQSQQPRTTVLHPFRGFSDAISVICYYPEISPSEVNSLIAVGFRGIVPKTIRGKDLVRIVCAIAFGGTYQYDIPHKIDGSRDNSFVSSRADPGVLSERELDVLRKIAFGKSMKEIATLLQVSIKTVDTYKTRASQKLALRSRAEIVQYAIQSGWMS